MDKIKNFFTRNPFILVLLIIFLVGTVGYGVYLIIYNVGNANQQEKYERLRDEAFVRVDSISTEAEIAVEEDSPYMSVQEFLEIGNNNSLYREYLVETVPDFEVLKRSNGDVIAYVVIPDSKVSYPILQSEDNEFYLNRNMDCSRGYPGCLFVENYNQPSFDDAVTIVYGHNMRNNTMFGSLDRYADSTYREEHPYIILYLPDEVRVYEVVVASKYSDEHLLVDCFEKEADGTYTFYGLNGDEGVNFMSTIADYNARGAFVDSDKVEETDKFLVLSTCNGSNQRYIVGAKRIL